MSRPSDSDHKKPEKGDSFREQIKILFEELSFAIKWRRPSILLVFYESEYTQGMAELALEKRLVKLGQQVVQFTVNEKNFDIPLSLSQRPDRDRSIYSVTGLYQGGGKGDANAYRALNMRREYFVDFSVRVIIWLSKGEAYQLSRHAPDFWAFRHRMVELLDASDPEYLLKKNIVIAKQLNKVDLLAKFWESLGLIYLDSDQLNRAIRAYWKAIRFNPQDAGLLNGLGQTYLVQGQLKAAQRVFNKAIRVNPQDARAWINLGHLYRREGRFSDAIIPYQQAIILDPQNSLAHSSLAAVYRLLGKDDLVAKQTKLAQPIAEKQNEYHRAVFECVSGNNSQAIKLLTTALGKKQIGVNRVRHDPNFEFIRDDPQFEMLLDPKQLNSRES
jgi:tetratricopeptide (TPR) repeat protein